MNLQRGLIILQDTKNRERRALPLAGYALECMRQHAEMRRPDTALVFPGPTGTKPLRIRDAFENAVTRVGIEDFTFHDLRQVASH